MLGTDLVSAASPADTGDTAEQGDRIQPHQALTVVELMSPALPGLTLDDGEREDRYVGKASADATKRAYTSDWRVFVRWCEAQSIRPLPSAPAVVAAFLAEEADGGIARSTIGRRLAAIVFAHRAANHISPTEQVGAAILDRTLRGIRRDKRQERPPAWTGRARRDSQPTEDCRGFAVTGVDRRCGYR